MKPISLFAKHLASPSPICELMQDLADAHGSANGQVLLGGGNPAHICQVERAIQDAVQGLANDPVALARAIGDYDGPGGNQEFIEVLCDYLVSRYKWPIGPQNIALTNGSQNAFFALTNLFSGRMSDGSFKRILLPICPEYVGYADAAIDPQVFYGIPAKIELIGDQQFKYHPDLDLLYACPDIGAVCISRPSNPSGNLISDQHLEYIWQFACQAGVPLILDCAYGQPFPGIVYAQANAFWRPNTILCLSLSKLGLPGLRTGIVIAEPQIIRAITSINAAMGLAPGGLGPAIMTRLIRSGAIDGLCHDVIRPFYLRRIQMAVELITGLLADLPVRFHRPEGAFFLWLWLQGLQIDNIQVYRRLKAEGVIVVPGSYFFFGLQRPWQHADRCIRVSLTASDQALIAGLRRLCAVIRALYQ
ncbi:MAG: valine--pyruvate transaminase [Sedimentisphaerales bacterium]|nr:valine--pyruvate transaminase [Sedimentisphaerales bacterium]